MAKKTPKVKFKGVAPEGRVIKAKIPTTVMGPKISFPHRYSAVIDTGVEVTCPPGTKIDLSLVPALSARGMLGINLAGGVRSGKVVVVLINVGREIVEVKDGDPLVEVTLSADNEFEWEAE